MTRAGSTGGATTNAIREWMPRRLRIALPFVDRLKKLPHSPESAIGTTGTGVVSMICWMPGRNELSSPVSVSLPSGKIPTISPASSALAASAKARSFICASSLAGAMGIVRIVRKMNDSTGTLKIRWSMTNRIGLRMHAAMTTAST